MCTDVVTISEHEELWFMMHQGKYLFLFVLKVQYADAYSAWVYLSNGQTDRALLWIRYAQRRSYK